MKIQKHFLVAALLTSALSACNEQPTTPTPQPTVAPTSAPSTAPTTRPTSQPTAVPSSAATTAPTAAPTSQPSSNPAPSATASAVPTASASTPVNTNVPAPLNFRVTERSSSTIFVTFTFPSFSQPSSYNLYLNGTQVVSGLTSNNYSYVGLSPDTSYSLAVETVTANGVSERSTITQMSAESINTGSGGSGGGGGGGGTGGGATTTASFTQVERLARPAINEGLIRQIKNTILNTWNMVPPSADLSDVQAAVDIRTEAVTVLGAIQSQVQIVLGYTAGPTVANGNNANGTPGHRTPAEQTARVGELAGTFLPDVMRIDTTGPSGYAAGIMNLTTPRPHRGRRLDDDVMDITLQVLVPGGALEPEGAGTVIEGAETDSVEYTDTIDNIPAGIRIHDAIVGTFPYLPAPN